MISKLPDQKHGGIGNLAMHLQTNSRSRNAPHFYLFGDGAPRRYTFQWNFCKLAVSSKSKWRVRPNRILLSNLTRARSL